MAEEKFVPNFKKKYTETVAPQLMKDFGFKSPMQIPKLEKITVSVGVGEATTNKKLLDAAVKELEQITGQHVVKTKARKSIANFKVREGQEIGAMVTLRGDNMWYFLERLICIALPRVKDFRGVNPNAFDGHGNYSLGIVLLSRSFSLKSIMTRLRGSAASTSLSLRQLRTMSRVMLFSRLSGCRSLQNKELIDGKDVTYRKVKKGA